MALFPCFPLFYSAPSPFQMCFFPPVSSLPTTLLSSSFCLALCEPLSCLPAEFLCPDTGSLAEGQDWSYSRCNLHFAQGSLITPMIKYN